MPNLWSHLVSLIASKKYLYLNNKCKYGAMFSVALSGRDNDYSELSWQSPFPVNIEDFFHLDRSFTG